MTPRKTPSDPRNPPLPDFQPDRFYAVDLERKTVWNGRGLSPAHNPLELRGDVAQAVRADIAKARLLG
ncbi:MAG: hypothetical protein U1C74_09000 [Phenylobacterium sp.]|nr:hypothetical protein [Phenylobacterium sp.]